MTDKKTSLLVSKQVPGFILQEYPKFISFLEAYYEFLDLDGYGKAKDLRYVSDVDQSLDDFEQQFFNSFIPFVPRNLEINKEFVIKNILPLYLSKGSEKSYRLLFRMLFGEEITIERPGKQILRASDGRWKIENYLRTETQITSNRISDGTTLEYKLPYEVISSDLQVFVDDVLTEDYVVRKEYKKLFFNTAPAENSNIKFVFNSFDTTVLESRKIVGLASTASALVERVSRKSIAGLTFYQFFIDKNTTIGEFENGETVKIVLPDGDHPIELLLQTFADLERIDIINGGANYNIGDPVIIRGISNRQAIAVVDDVTSGAIDQFFVTSGGTGYKVNDSVLAQNVDPSLFFAVVDSVNTSGLVTPNTITYNTDLISNLASVTIDSVDYGFSGAGIENVDSVISEALTTQTITNLGIITSINVETSRITSQSSPQFVIESSNLYSGTTVADLGVIGRIDIINGGANYNLGEYLIFTNDYYFSGQGANAYISNVSVTGEITEVRIVDGGLSYDLQYPPTITVDTANGSNAVLSVGSIMGRDAVLTPENVNDVIGRILSIRLLEAGSGYTLIPIIDLTRIGDGTATAEAVLRDSLVVLPGKWTTPDSLLSNDEIRLQGRDYYINYSYVIGSQVEFAEYKSLLRNLLHPAGLINYAKYRIFDNLESQIINEVSTSLIKTVSGTIQTVANSNNIIGINSDFITAQTLGIINVGDSIAVSNDVVSITNIITANSLTVNTAMTVTSNSEIIKILT